MLRAAERLNDVVVAVADLVDNACVRSHALEVVDISEMVADEVATCRERAAQQGVRLVVSGEPAQQCIADSRRLRRALRALLDNALTCAPDRSTVRVASTTSATGTRITVTQGGDGTDADGRARLARPSGPRTHPRQPAADQEMALALASAVAAWHGGRLVLSERLGQGVQALIELPRTSPT
jgi:signal transduction histidine kinase